MRHRETGFQWDSCIVSHPYLRAMAGAVKASHNLSGDVRM